MAGRSFSEEVANRLAQSFVQPAPGAYGSDEFTFAFCRHVPRVVESVEAQTGRRWNEDPLTYRRCKEGIVELLHYLPPIGDEQVSDDAPLMRAAIQTGHQQAILSMREAIAGWELGKLAARSVLYAVEEYAETGAPTWNAEMLSAARVLKAQLDRAGMLGEADRELRADDPHAPVRGGQEPGSLIIDPNAVKPGRRS